MEQLKSLTLTGIQRNSPQGMSEACDELVNVRFTDGSWQPTGVKDLVRSPDGATVYPAHPFDEAIIHKMDSGNNWIGYSLPDVHKVVRYNPATLEILQEIVTLTPDEILQDLRFLKKFLLVITDKTLYRFLLKDGAYKRIDLGNLAGSIVTSLFPKDAVVNKYTEYVSTPEALLGKYYEMLRSQSDDGRMYGGLFYRVVIKLYDGTEILHTVPKYYQVSNHAGLIERNAGNYRLKINELDSIFATTAYVPAIIGVSMPYEDLKDVITAIELYASRCLPLYEISEDTMTAENFLTWFPTSGTIKNFSEIFQVAEDFKTKLHDSTNWYKLGEVSYNALKVNEYGYYSADMVLDLKGFYYNFATRTQPKVDNFTHHELTGYCSSIYNSRLNLGDTRQRLSNYMPFIGLPSTLPICKNPYGSAPATINYLPDTPAYYEARYQVKLVTNDGTKHVDIYATLSAFKDALVPSNKAIFLDNDFAYPDSRAISIAVHIKVGATWKLLKDIALEKSQFGNYALSADRTFDPVVTDTNGVLARRVDANFVSYPIQFRVADLTDSTFATENRIVADGNRAQPCEVDNPFVFPVENSQQISTSGVIRAFGVNTEDVSSAQFGQYPLYVFTSEGIWGLSIGTGSVYITNVQPLSGEVLISKRGKLDLSFGIAFITSEGLRLISGKEVVDIGLVVEGAPDPYIRANAHVQFLTAHPSLVSLLPVLDSISFDEYLKEAVLGFNKGFDEAEIIVANPAYPYYYVYSLVNKIWFKMTGTLSRFTSDYPSLYAVDESREAFVNLSKEVPGQVQCLFLTRALSMSMGEAAKKLRRSFVRCHITLAANKFAGAYLFKSDNLKKWTLSTGNDRNTGEVKDIWLTHSMNSSRYWTYLFVATLQVDPLQNTNYITHIETEVTAKMQDKLR